MLKKFTKLEGKAAPTFLPESSLGTGVRGREVTCVDAEFVPQAICALCISLGCLGRHRRDCEGAH